MKSSSLFEWSRRVPAVEAETWVERVGWAAPHPPTVTERAGGRTAVLAVCSSERALLDPLVKMFKGRVRSLHPDAWKAGHRRDFRMRVGSGLWVVSGDPSIRTEKLERLLRVPAGMAFGSGEHATTAMCLRRLAELLRYPITGGRRLRVLDAGTGSGILALAASALGARVEAFDSDPDCVAECQANARRNPWVPAILWKRADVRLFTPGARADVLVANLYAPLLVESMSRFSRWTAQNGALVLSGILKEQENEVVRAGSRVGWGQVRRWRKGKWVCLLLRRKGP